MATPLIALIDSERQLAAARFEILRPFLQQRVALTHVARQHDLKPPSYGLVYAIVNDLSPALTTLAHQGAKRMPSNSIYSTGRSRCPQRHLASGSLFTRYPRAA